MQHVKIRKDLTGKKFHKLLVIERGDDIEYSNGVWKSAWVCKCDCGGITPPIATSQLTSGHTKSCGCLQKETVIAMNKANRKMCKYDLSGEYGVGYTSNGCEFYFDIEDYDKIKDYSWCIDNKGYVCEGREGLRQHRIIMGVTNHDDFVDHIHGKETRNDNRKSNLRVVTRSQNGMNAALMSNNTSGTTGVIWNKYYGKWTANIVLNCKRIFLGRFDTYNEAVQARKEAEEKYYGEYSYDNSQQMHK